MEREMESLKDALAPTQQFMDKINEGKVAPQEEIIEEELIEEDQETEEESEEQEEETENTENYEYEFDLKVRGEDLKKQYTEQDIVKALNKAEDYDRSMSKLNFEKQKFDEQQENLATQLKDANDLLEKGRILNALEKQDPDILKRLTGGKIQDQQAQVDPVDERYRSLKEKVGSEDYRDTPLEEVLEYATQIKRTYDSDKQKLVDEIKSLKDEVESVKKFKDESLTQRVQNTLAQEEAELSQWANENQIDLKSHPELFSYVETLARQGKSFLSFAKNIYSGYAKPSQSKTTRVVTEERKPVKVNRQASPKKVKNKDDYFRQSIYGK